MPNRLVLDRAFRVCSERAFARARPVGMAAAVVTPLGQFSIGLGKLRHDADDEVDSDSLFPIASCTKAFTAALAMILAEQGKLALDDHIADLLPEVEFATQAMTGMMTLRDLLAHRTGMARVMPLEMTCAFTQDEMLERLRHIPFAAPFRTRMTYTNIGYLLAGTAMARRMGKSYPDLIEEHILQPLAMHSSFARFGQAVAKATLAMPHVRTPEGPLAVARIDRTMHAPASIIHSTANDMARWIQMHLAHGAPLLLEASWREMHSPQIVRPLDAETRELYPDALMVAHGLGWNLYEDDGVLISRHSGEIDGFASLTLLAPALGLGVYVVNNSGDDGFSLQHALELFDTARGRTVVRRGVTKRVEDEIAERAIAGEDIRLIGDYTSKASGDVSISNGEDGLLVEFTQMSRCNFDMRPLVDGRWRAIFHDATYAASGGWNFKLGSGGGAAQATHVDMAEFGMFERKA